MVHLNEDNIGESKMADTENMEDMLLSVVIRSLGEIWGKRL